MTPKQFEFDIDQDNMLPKQRPDEIALAIAVKGRSREEAVAFLDRQLKAAEVQAKHEWQVKVKKIQKHNQLAQTSIPLPKFKRTAPMRVAQDAMNLLVRSPL